MNKIIILGLFFALALAQRAKQTPIIGIYTQIIDSNQPINQVKHDQHYYQVGLANVTYIAASYVKYLEMSGAQVVPLYAYKDKAYYDNILPKINGVLFPGGGCEINIKNRWTQNADYIVKYMISEQKKGKTFPIWGTCLGIQLLMYLTSGYDSKAIGAVRGQTAMTNTVAIQPGSYLYSGLSTDTLYKLQNGQGLLYFNHHYGILKDYYKQSQALKAFWNIDSYTTTPYSEDFVSAARGKQYPIFGVQYHPEKTLFQWKVFAQRSDTAVDFIQILSNRFVQEARKSTNTFADISEFDKINIYNFKTYPTTMSFSLIYKFDEPTSVDGWQNPQQFLAEQK